MLDRGTEIANKSLRCNEVDPSVRPLKETCV